tara:strand:- start:147 stop:371 length:225 start_codon:yes stop_codon:yes gene_type:complete
MPIDVGEIVDIPNLGKRVKIAEKYDYQEDKCVCPNCRGIGIIPWNGWGTCQCCPCVALIETGDAFMPVNQEEGE